MNTELRDKIKNHLHRKFGKRPLVTSSNIFNQRTFVPGLTIAASTKSVGLIKDFITKNYPEAKASSNHRLGPKVMNITEFYIY